MTYSFKELKEFVDKEVREEVKDGACKEEIEAYLNIIHNKVDRYINALELESEINQEFYNELIPYWEPSYMHRYEYLVLSEEDLGYEYGVRLGEYIYLFLKQELEPNTYIKRELIREVVEDINFSNELSDEILDLKERILKNTIVDTINNIYELAFHGTNAQFKSMGKSDFKKETNLSDRPYVTLGKNEQDRSYINKLTIDILITLDLVLKFLGYKNNTNYEELINKYKNIKEPFNVYRDGIKTDLFDFNFEGNSINIVFKDEDIPNKLNSFYDDIFEDLTSYLVMNEYFIEE